MGTLQVPSLKVLQNLFLNGAIWCCTLKSIYDKTPSFCQHMLEHSASVEHSASYVLTWLSKT